MPNLLGDFKSFYLKVVLPNLPSYGQYFGWSNFDKNIMRLSDEYSQTFGENPFEVDDICSSIDSIVTNLSGVNNSFRNYSESIGNDVPLAILLTHYTTFLKYRNQDLVFNNLQGLIERIHANINSIGKKYEFISSFRAFRSRMNGDQQIRKKHILFGDVRDNYWSINIGAEKEIQYHIHLIDSSLRYGLGFNIIGSSNNHDPVGNVRPYQNAFYANRKCLDDILQDYVFIENDENNLRELLYGTFILYGKSLQIVKSSDSFAIKGFDFLELLYDLKNKQFKAYKIVFEKSKQPIYKLVDDMHTRKVMDILQYKKQIILQGPPGTGKTRLAREVASQLSTPMYIEDNDIVSNIHLGQEVFGKEKVSYRVLKIESRAITLELEGGSLKTCSFDGIKEAYFNYSQGRSLKGGDTYTTAIAIAVFNAVSYNTRIVQFHPSYTYEDFVRGVVVQTNAGVAEYKSIDKILMQLAKTANDNYLDSHKNGATIVEERKVQEYFWRFKNLILDKIGEESRCEIVGTHIFIIDVDAESFVYSSDSYNGKVYNLSFVDFIQAYNDKPKNLDEIRNNPLISHATRHRPSYCFQMLEMFKSYIKETQLNISERPEDYNIGLRNYVLILDEINRANLSSVLGELIYALEYRGEEVDSMYSVNGSSKLTIPPNLYIIGTMNTADRSAGHIDYAIRRRFAFVDVLPKDLSEDPDIKFHAKLFREVSKLFVENVDEYLANSNSTLKRASTLSAEFRPEDVWLGHSYFIQKKEKDKEGNEVLVPDDFGIRVQYEIKPILLEYVKDGVLMDTKGGNDLVKRIKNLNVID